MSPRELARLLLEAARNWMKDEVASMGAALAFYTLFSMAPLLLLVIAIAGLVIGTDVAQGLMMGQLTALLGEKGAGAVQAVLKAADNRAEGLIAATASLATLVLGATTVFAELRRDLDKIWKHETPSTSGAWNYLRARLLSFGLVLTIGFLLMVSLVLSAAVTALGTYVAGGWPIVMRALEFLVSCVVITGLFAMIYKLLPSVSIEWSDVWVGAAVTSLLFWIGKYLIGLYLGKSAVASPFGAAGTLVVVIVWVYYSAQIFFLGAEFTKAYAMRRGSLRAAFARNGGT
ncbi:MAG: YihY/virulence factor BrkB family protein [Usitatibacter sp.]